MGDKKGRSQVHYETYDGTAKAGESYEKVNGTLFFEPNEDTKEIKIRIMNDSAWRAILEFEVKLELDNQVKAGCSLGPYLHHTRVKIIDGSIFPSDKYHEAITEDRIDDIPLWGLLFEYFKVNWRIPTVRCGTIKTILVDQMHNLNFVFELFMAVFLIDYLLSDKFMAHDHEKKRFWLQVYILSLILPFALLHLLDYQKLRFKIGGTSRIYLQENLLRRFFNMEESAREKLDPGDLIVAITGNVEELVKHGYMNVLNLFRFVGQLIMVLVYQLLAPIVFDKPRRYVIFGPLIAFPVILLPFMLLRATRTSNFEGERKDQHMRVVSFLSFLVTQYRLIVDYSQRTAVVLDCENMMQGYNTAATNESEVVLNNTYFSPWIGLLFVAAYTYIGGLQLVMDEHQDSMTLGMFLTNIGIVKRVGDCYGSSYKTLLAIQSTGEALRHIVYAMNLPTDLRARSAAMDKRRVETKNVREKLRAENPGVTSGLLDKAPIKFGNINFAYHSSISGNFGGDSTIRKTLHRQHIKGCFEIEQGSMVCLIGPRGGGKATLLKILGGVLIPEDETSDVFVPAHLRVLHVPVTTYFYKGTLLQNLTFGLKEGAPGSNLKHVKRVCQRLGVSKHAMEWLGSEAKAIEPWLVVLSRTDQQLLSIARAFVFNPEVLFIHKPTLPFGEILRQRIVELLREFVTNKGIEQAQHLAYLRRPRTVILTSTDAACATAADRVFSINQVNGTKEVVVKEERPEEVSLKMLE